MAEWKKSISRFLNTRKLHAVAINEETEKTRIIYQNGDTSKDITGRHALISLKPFMIAIAGEVTDGPGKGKEQIQICEENIILGELILHLNEIKTTTAGTLLIYTASITANPLSSGTRMWNSALLSLKNRTDRKSSNFIVPPRELLKLFVYTLKPRPVFLISVMHEKGLDIFPIDIFGKVSEHQIAMGIRATSPVIPYLLKAGKFCAATIPFEKRAEAYLLGKHHAGGVLPAGYQGSHFVDSEKLKIPVTVFSANVLELEVKATFSKGVHQQFVAEIINSYELNDTAILAHTPWFNKKYFNHRF